MSEFFSTPAGIAVFTVLAVAVIVFIIEVNYKYFTKSALDFLFALIFNIVLSPVYLALAIASKVNLNKHGGGRILKMTPMLGYKGETIAVYSYALYSFGGEYLGGYADFLKRTHLENLPRLLNVLQLKLSFVGIKPLAIRDRGFIEDEDFTRFNARPGLVSPVILKGGEETTFEEMFALERRYVKRREMFYDIRVIIYALLRLIRGNKTNYLGEAKDKDYCEVLLARGEITAEQIEQAESETV